MLFTEGNETMKFWDDLGGKEKYFTGMRRQESVKVETRLFHCSNSSGKFNVEEVCNFTQEVSFTYYKLNCKFERLDHLWY